MVQGAAPAVGTGQSGLSRRTVILPGTANSDPGTETTGPGVGFYRKIRKITPAGVVKTIWSAWSVNSLVCLSGSSIVQLLDPQGLTVDWQNNIYIAIGSPFYDVSEQGPIRDEDDARPNRRLFHVKRVREQRLLALHQRGCIGWRVVVRNRRCEHGRTSVDGPHHCSAAAARPATKPTCSAA